MTIAHATPDPTRRRRRTGGALIGLLVAGALVLAGCSSSEDTAEDPPGTTVAPSTATGDPAGLCIRFPLRDADAPFAATADPALAGDRATIDRLLEMAANGLVESAPEAIRPAVETYVSALRDFEPGTDPRATPSTRAAMDELDAWLRARCGPPPATTP